MQGAASPEDVVAAIAEKVHVIRPIVYRFASTMQRWLDARIEEVSAYDFRVRILAEAATQEVFTADARRGLERLYSKLVDDSSDRIADALEVLIHDGYLIPGENGHRFSSRLLKDWWSARFRDHHDPLGTRRSSLGDSDETIA